VFVVIGIGGSYLGARAAVEIFGAADEAGSENAARDGGKKAPEILFAGQNISGTYHASLLNSIKNREVCLCVVSKSGTTAEPNIAFSVLKSFLIEKYGPEEARKRIYAITDPTGGSLRAEAAEQGYETFEIPADIGGRYSVLTAVGLFPMAVAGVDIGRVLSGAGRAVSEGSIKAAKKYAAARKALFDGGKAIEVIEHYEPALFYFAEWLKQLFGESEGKNGTGLFPAALSFSADLHSMGQFLQEGRQIFFETVLNVVSPPGDLTAPRSADPLLAGRSMNAVNRAAMEGVIAAHRAADIPIIRIDVPDLSPESFGLMVFFFELSCAFTAYLMDVNPFDQPGVEQYKKEMKRILAETRS
jgi:glucose-6-phosphate isomerase